MYRIDEERAFVDSVDGQMVALLVETGAYYTFDEAATAAITDLGAGNDPARVAQALAAASGDADAPAKLDAFVGKVVELGILAPAEGEPAEGELACAGIAPGELKFDMEGYDDVAAYFMIDPIHEVDPDMGWPYVTPE